MPASSGRAMSWGNVTRAVYHPTGDRKRDPGGIRVEARDQAVPGRPPPVAPAATMS
jgi:hypothetical protein